MNEALELREISHDIFVNVHRPWLPKKARGIYGGVWVGHALIAASKTVPRSAAVRSIHCNFILGGDPDEPLAYHVERLGEDEDSIVRRVAARQKGKTALIATVRFQQKQQAAPTVSRQDAETMATITALSQDLIAQDDTMSGGNTEECPFLCTRIRGPDMRRRELHERRTTQWAKSKDQLKEGDDMLRANVAALGYMTDNYLLSAASRAGNYDDGIDPEEDVHPPRKVGDQNKRQKIDMMLSLDHSVYFHAEASQFRADDWMFIQMECPWIGDGRATVVQRVYTKAGVPIATAKQEVSAPCSSFRMDLR